MNENPIKPELVTNSSSTPLVASKQKCLITKTVKTNLSPFILVKDQIAYAGLFPKILQTRKTHHELKHSLLVTFVLNLNYYRILLEHRHDKESSYRAVIENLKRMQEKLQEQRNKRLLNKTVEELEDIDIEKLYSEAEIIRNFEGAIGVNHAKIPK